MKQGTTFRQWLCNALTTLRAKLITAIVPRHTRRAIFACSLAAQFFPQNQELHKRLARKLVADLNLNCAYDSMLAPMSWSNWIWSKLPTIEMGPTTTIGSMVQSASSVIQSTPLSLLYASPRLMEEDVVATLRAVSDLQSK